MDKKSFMIFFFLIQVYVLWTQDLDPISFTTTDGIETMNEARKLQEPIKVYTEHNGHYILSVEYCPYKVMDYENNKILLNMISRCYCYNNKCSIPGPTFFFYDNTNISFTFINNLIGSNENKQNNHNIQHDPDVINLHTHGLHVDPEDDNVLIAINPNENFTYHYHLASDIYPGTHWYHSHWHGSANLHMQGGLQGVLIVDHQDKNNWDINLINIPEHILMIQWIWVSKCNCDEFTGTYVRFIGPFRISSYCFEWCSMPEEQRIISGLNNYQVETDIDNNELLLVNGQYQPYIDQIYVNEYHRLRIINTVAQYYLHVSFPIEHCSFYYIARDGVFLDNDHGHGINRNIENAPWYGELLIPPAGRIDIIVKCNQEGIFNIITTKSIDKYSWLDNMPRIDANLKIFSLFVQSNFFSNNAIIELPNFYPIKPLYLQNTLNFEINNNNNIEMSLLNTCYCNNYDESSLSFQNCGFELNLPPKINNIPFMENFTLTYLLFDHIYEMELYLHYHPFHQHIYPFQLTENVGDGFIGHTGDWFDSIGLDHTKIRMNVINYKGKIVIHCHMLSHADLGMMAVYEVVDSYDSLECLNSFPTSSPTKVPTFKPTRKPTKSPTLRPTRIPTFKPTRRPTFEPTPRPTKMPTLRPTKRPTEFPTLKPTKNPTLKPTKNPTKNPTFRPTKNPTFRPTKKPAGV